MAMRYKKVRKWNKKLKIREVKRKQHRANQVKRRDKESTGFIL